MKDFKLKYSWRELELISFTTATNIISFIQFAIIPLNHQKKIEKTQRQFDLDPLNETSGSFISRFDIQSIIDVFVAPFDFLGVFMQMATSLRVLLFSSIVIGAVEILFLTFFFPTWRMYVFLVDFFLPTISTMCLVMIAHGYQPALTFQIMTLIIGLLYTTIRAGFQIWMFLKSRKENWVKYITYELSALFFAKITSTRDNDFIEDEHERLRADCVRRDDAIHTDFYSDNRRLVDLGLAVLLSVLLAIIIWGIRIDRIFGSMMSEDNAAAMNYFVSIFLITFFVLACLKIIVSLIYFFRFLPRLFHWLRRMSFKLVIVATGVVLIPILNMILTSTTTSEIACPYNFYYDYQSNQSTFLDYFMNRTDVACQPCSRASSLNFPICAVKCSFNQTYRNVFVSDSPFVDASDVIAFYTLPTSFIEIFFLVVFLQMIEFYFHSSLKVAEAIPAPSSSVEIKYRSVLEKIQSTGTYVFGSYRHKQALFNFNFTQAKNFVLFFSLLLPIFPLDIVAKYSSTVIPILFSVVCFLISFMSIFSRPYRSILHNVVNAISYFVGGIAAAITTLSAMDYVMPTTLTTGSFVLIFITPIIVALVTPFFVKPSKGQNGIPYRLRTIIRRNRTILPDTEAFKEDDFNITDSEEMSFIDFEDEDQENFLADDFDSGIMSPCHIQLAIDMGLEVENRVKSVCLIHDLKSTDFDDATEKMFSIVDLLLDVTSLQTLLGILTFATFFCSFCSGWGLGAGLSNWKDTTRESTLKCDWQSSSSPDFPNSSLYTCDYTATDHLKCNSTE